MRSKTRSAEYLVISMDDACLRSMRCPVQKRRDSRSGLRMKLGNLLEAAKENAQVMNHKAESTDTSIRGEPPRSRGEFTGLSPAGYLLTLTTQVRKESRRLRFELWKIHGGCSYRRERVSKSEPNSLVRR
jgi:hypothetical protein